jgi:DNA-binding response OmpR family regulator
VHGRTFPIVRILLAEDDRPLRHAIARGLREASYAVDEVEIHAHALERAAAHAYDAIVLDLVAVGGDGVRTCRDLRTQGVQAPILVVVTLGAAEQRIAALDAGADDCVTKPFELSELLARLRALTRRRGSAPATDIVVGDLVVDSARYTARRGQRPLLLTGKEFALLEHLARNAGRLVSRAELSVHIWDAGKPPLSNLIDVYISRLRRKVDGGEAVRLFSTHRGKGYVLAAPDTPIVPDAPAGDGRGARTAKQPAPPRRA